MYILTYKYIHVHQIHEGFYVHVRIIWSFEFRLHVVDVEFYHACPRFILLVLGRVQPFALAPRQVIQKSGNEAMICHQLAGLPWKQS